MVNVRCPNCGSSFVLGEGDCVSTTNAKDGIAYLIPSTVRNENVGDNKMNERMEALKKAGVNVDKLRELMEGNSSFKDIFNEDDPILNELSQSNFIRNNELFRRWITAQTFRLLKMGNSWTSAVRRTYDIKYAYRMTIRELKTLCLIYHKSKTNDKRFNFFTFGALKEIFAEFIKRAYNLTDEQRTTLIAKIRNADTLDELFGKIPYYLRFEKRTRIPEIWINCFKGAGAYYTLQNVIRTHGLIVNGCKDINDSLETVERIFNDIVSYKWNERRWDILMSLLKSSVINSHFELKY